MEEAINKQNQTTKELETTYEEVGKIKYDLENFKT